MIDTHVHLDHEKFKNTKANLEDVDRVIQICTSTEISKEIQKIITEHGEKIELAIGIHPVDVSQFKINDLEILKKTLSSHDIIAIGEIGLDLHWYPEELDKQILFFKEQLRIAKENNLPVIIHARNAYKEVIQILSEKEFKNSFGVIHSFSGTQEEANQLIKCGFLLGFTGPITFKNGTKQVEILKNIDIKNILAETDSPFLTPEPNRGKVNNPKNIVDIVKKIAKIKKINFKECETILDKNAIKLFELKE